jgi:hypothetical protein
VNLYFDLDTGNFVSSRGTSDVVSKLTFKRGDTTSLPVRFCRGITFVELASGASGILGLKETTVYDGEFIAAAASWTKTGTGTSTVYTFNLNLATTELNTLLGVGAAADVASVDLHMEMEFLEGDVRTSSNTILATVRNDIVKGDESGPTDITGGTPVNGVEATITLTIDQEPTVGDTFTIGTETWSWVLSSPTAFQIEVGASDIACAANAATAITADSAYVSATADGITKDLVITALMPGTGGHLAVSQVGDVLTGIGNLSGGVSPTSGYLGTMQVDADFLYVVCSVTDDEPLWKKIALSSL